VSGLPRIPASARPGRSLSVRASIVVRAPLVHPARVSDENQTNEVREDRRWQAEGWSARIFKNEDDDGWAVSMTRDGEPEPTIVVPWTMGRDKKNPKPLDKGGFTVLLKNATETRMRTEQQRHARLHKSIEISLDDERIRVELDLVEDEYDPHAWLSAHSSAGEQLARTKVEPSFKLSSSSATKWARNGYGEP
jgi:hypothetical protein